MIRGDAGAHLQHFLPGYHGQGLETVLTVEQHDVVGAVHRYALHQFTGFGDVAGVFQQVAQYQRNTETDAELFATAKRHRNRQSVGVDAVEHAGHAVDHRYHATLFEL